MNDLIASTADSDTAVTMASFELVDFINSQRKESESELRHDHFMAKVPKVIGEEAAPKFRDSYIGRDGTTRPCYRFPKREACLMAMSYSYELQAKVFDRMTELEAQASAPLPPPSINVNMLADAVDRGLMTKRTAANMIKAWMLAQNPAMAAVLAAQQRKAPTPAPAPTQMSILPAPKPKRYPPKPKPFKISPRRGRGEVNGVNFVLEEIADYCGLSMRDLLESMRTHGLINEVGSPTVNGREFVAFTRRGNRHWKVGALMRHLSA